MVIGAALAIAGGDLLGLVSSLRPGVAVTRGLELSAADNERRQGKNDRRGQRDAQQG